MAEIYLSKGIKVVKSAFNEYELQNALLVTKAKGFDDISLWIPTHSYVLVSVRRYDEVLVWREETASQNRSVAQNKVSARWVFMRSQGITFRLFRGSSYFGVQGIS